ncbi:MAG TPA: hypothetical protein PKM73_01980 [Verrucomicrobiota bacterium]|nr:hypothetical protein [Verrucomicrobiota bacterium]HNU50320.1 hypothetical protein [Verrucomicrobiota bacterium]
MNPVQLPTRRLTRYLAPRLQAVVIVAGAGTRAQVPLGAAGEEPQVVIPTRLAAAALADWTESRGPLLAACRGALWQAQMAQRHMGFAALLEFAATSDALVATFISGRGKPVEAEKARAFVRGNLLTLARAVVDIATAWQLSTTARNEIAALWQAEDVLLRGASPSSFSRTRRQLERLLVESAGALDMVLIDVLTGAPPEGESRPAGSLSQEQAFALIAAVRRSEPEAAREIRKRLPALTAADYRPVVSALTKIAVDLATTENGLRGSGWEELLSPSVTQGLMASAGLGRQGAGRLAAALGATREFRLAELGRQAESLVDRLRLPPPRNSSPSPPPVRIPVVYAGARIVASASARQFSARQSLFEAIRRKTPAVVMERPEIAWSLILNPPAPPPSPEPPAANRGQALPPVILGIDSSGSTGELMARGSGTVSSAETLGAVTLCRALARLRRLGHPVPELVTANFSDDTLVVAGTPGTGTGYRGELNVLVEQEGGSSLHVAAIASVLEKPGHWLLLTDGFLADEEATAEALCRPSVSASVTVFEYQSQPPGDDGGTLSSFTRRILAHRPDCARAFTPQTEADLLQALYATVQMLYPELPWTDNPAS